jgi:sulfatase maturation enzyme AslB (radical SAM superfamily)
MSDFFCPLPWISTSIRNDGKLRVCCHANQGPNRGELNWDVDDISGSRNSPKLKETRRQILSGQWPDDCIRCKKESEAGIRTRFQYESEIWKDEIPEKDAQNYTENDGTIDTDLFPLIYYDLRFGNFCNLKCRYCSPYSSSALGTVPGDYKWFERNSFWDHLRENIYDIELFHIEGGEPLLIKQHYDFMAECINLDRAKDIKIEYTTSLTSVPEKAWEMWDHFKEVRIGTSMDAIGSVFDYIRYPSKFDVVNENLHTLDIAPGNFILWIACTISTLNIWYLPEFFKWKIKQRFGRVNRKPGRPFCSDHPIHAPKHFNIKSLPIRVKAKVTDHLLSSISGIDKVADKYEYDPFMKEEYKKATRNMFYSYIRYMNSEDFSTAHFPVFCQYNKRLDDERNQSMKYMLPDWYEVLNDN